MPGCGLEEESSSAQACGTKPTEAFSFPGLSSCLCGVSCAPLDSRPVLLPDTSTLWTQLERAHWEALPSCWVLVWDGDVLEGGPVSLPVHHCRVGPGGGGAGCAKGKAGYKEGGKYEELKAI